MSLQDRVQADLKEAMRAGETLRRDTLRMVLAAMKNVRIDVGRALEPAEELGVLQSAVKSRGDSAEQFDKAGRPELAEKERAEIEVIKVYLPRALSEDETLTIVRAKIDELGIESKKDLGRLMKAVMAEHKGSVDGKAVQRIAAGLLA